MDQWWQTVGTMTFCLILVWLVLVGALMLAARRTPDPVTLREVVRWVPDVVRLTHRLASDRTLPWGIRARLWLLLGYLLLPIDLVPDFLPVIGYADDAIAVALVLRSVTRAAGPTALEERWPGTPEGLATVRRLVGLGEEPDERRR